MKKNKKISYGKYAWGGDVDPTKIGNIATLGGNYLGAAIGQDTDVGGFLSGAGSGAGLGASIGSVVPGIGTAIGAIGGGLIGGIAGLFGAGKRKRAERARLENQRVANLSNYTDTINASLDTSNENPYGNMVFADGGTIHINPKNKGKFTASAKAAGMGVQEFASHVLANKDDYSSTQVKRANFARNATKFKHELGGEVLPTEIINIEKGELQIDPNTGKVLREYTGINPETGGLYEPHSKGKDTKNNLVSAEAGTFIITKKESKNYKDAIENNDVITQNTILQNIKNYKNSKKPSSKMALGSFVDPTKPPFLSAQNPLPTFNPEMILQQSRGLTSLPFRSANTGVPSPGTMLTGNILPTRPAGQVGEAPLAPTTQAYNPSTQSEVGPNGGGSNNPGLGTVLNSLAQYAPSLLNIGRGMFGKTEQQQYVQPILNPYTNQVLNNLPQDVSLNPLVNRIYRNQATQFRQIDNTTSGNPIARANKNNIFANTQNQLADVYMQQQQLNNQIRSQRGSIYNQLGQQQAQEQARTQQINLGIYDSNLQNKAARQNLLTTGLGQLQQVYQNQQLLGQQRTNDALRQRMLYEMFPNLRFYENTFNR